MGLIEWLRRRQTTRRADRSPGPSTSHSTPPIRREGMTEWLQRPAGDDDELHLFATEEEAKAAIRKRCKAVDYMVDGITFCGLQTPTRDGKFTYEIYKAVTAAQALQFLRAIPPSRIPPLYYITVEASGTKLGRDKEGIFDETTGATLE